MTSRWSNLLFVVASATACDPGYSVAGAVVVRGSGAPVEGAAVKIACPKGALIETTTDAAGMFHARGRTGIVPSSGCTLSASKAGFVTGSAPVDACTSQWVSCKKDVGRVELVAGP